jgi:hypothetical protein
VTAVTTWTVDALERAGKTVVQTLATTLLALGVALRWIVFWHALDIGLLAGVVALLTSVAAIPLSRQLTPALQVALRAGLTFVQSTLAFLAANTFLSLTSVPWVQVAQVSLLAAVTSVLTSWASWNVGPVKLNPSVVPTTAPAAA